MGEAAKIYDEFRKFLETGNADLVAKYSKVQVNSALNRLLGSDKASNIADQMRKRVKDLEALEVEPGEIRKRWKENALLLLIGFILGVLGTVIAQWIIKKAGLS